MIRLAALAIMLAFNMLALYSLYTAAAQTILALY